MATSEEQALGLVLKRIRGRTGLSQEAFGYEAGLDRTYVSAVERGRRNPTLKVVRRWLAAAGVRWEVFGRMLDAAERGDGGARNDHGPRDARNEHQGS